MSTFRQTFPAFLILVFLFISCKESKTSPEQIVETPKDTTTIQTETDNVATVTVLSDTIGLHKLSNTEAKTYIIEMNRILSDIDKAMDDNAPDRMPSLLGKQRTLQQNQPAIQSALTEADRTLFKIYANKIADRLLAIATRLEKME